jgi:glutamine cyclotransferase
MNRLPHTLLLTALLGMALVSSCTNAPEKSPGTATHPATSPLVASPLVAPTLPPISPLPAPATPTPAGAPTPIYGYEIVNVYPHDRDAFTQGLVFHDGTLYEGTGRRGRSTLRKVDLESGQVLQLYNLPAQFFGEGVTVYGDRIFQLTWQSHVGFVYGKENFELLQEFHYPNEGWGLTHDGERLIMSDGTATLHFLDPETLAETGRLEVLAEGRPVTRLNELEYVQGEIYANVWLTERVARIDPQTGQVSGWIELAGLLSPEDRAQTVDVLNGIAYDAENERLFVTGKLWPKLFEIKLVAP